MKLLPFVRVALFALLCCGMQPLQAAVGTIHSFEGDVRIVSATGDRAALAGLELNEGDTVRTGADAWALLAMSDGASMTLRPQSQLRIDTYRYDHDGDPTRNSSLLSLVKGAFRSVTGYIGRTNRDGYRITTPVATIGVRGTDHEPAHYPPPGPGEKLEHEPGTYDKVNDGESFIRHPKGEVAVKPGQHAFVHHNSLAAPRLLARAPAFYDRHVEVDKRAAARREDLHRKFEEQHQRRLQERQNKVAPRKDALEQKRSLNEKKQDDKQQHRRELIEQRQHERQSQQEHRNQDRTDEQKKRQQERVQKHDSKKDRDDDKKEHVRQR